MNFLILFIALGLAVFLIPLGLLFTIYVCIATGSVRKGFDYLSDAALGIALAIDLLGNILDKDLFNHTLIKAQSNHPFGISGETISSVLGKNKRNNTLTDLGRTLSNLLNWLQPFHVERAAGLEPLI